MNCALGSGVAGGAPLLSRSRPRLNATEPFQPFVPQFTSLGQFDIGVSLDADLQLPLLHNNTTTDKDHFCPDRSICDRLAVGMTASNINTCSCAELVSNRAPSTHVNPSIHIYSASTHGTCYPEAIYWYCFFRRKIRCEVSFCPSFSGGTKPRWDGRDSWFGSPESRPSRRFVSGNRCGCRARLLARGGFRLRGVDSSLSQPRP